LGKGGAALAGKSVATGTPEGLFDGFVAMDRGADFENGDRSFAVTRIDLSQIPDGSYVFYARAVAERSGPPIFTAFTVPFLIARGGTQPQPGMPLDSDGDGVLDRNDDCPSDYDPHQEDFDGDKVGNACDLCPLTPAGVAVDSAGCPLLS